MCSEHSDSDDGRDGSQEPAGLLRRKLTSFERRLTTVDGELASLQAAEDEDVEADTETKRDERKRLTGEAVLTRVLRRPALVAWLRRALDAGLSRAYDKAMFRLDGRGPLIPAVDWPGWPPENSAQTTGEAAPVDPTRLNRRRRQRRIAYLKRLRGDILSELDGVTKRYSPARKAANRQRMILVGVVFLKWSFRSTRVAAWLRRLLDVHLTDADDRSLFGLTPTMPLVPEEDRARLLRITPRRAAMAQAGDGGPPAADDHSQGSPSTPRGVGGRSSAASPPVRSDIPVTPAKDVASRPAQDPIPGWQPVRIRVPGSSDAGVRTQRTTWGAQLTGRAAVAALPRNLRGRQIAVTDSNEVTWTTRITDIVSRDDTAVVVCNTGRPGRDAAAARRSEEFKASSS